MDIPAWGYGLRYQYGSEYTAKRFDLADQMYSLHAGRQSAGRAGRDSRYDIFLCSGPGLIAI